MPAETNANGAQTLLIDADDTLWENNIYFERAIANFISFLNHHEYSPEQVREVLNQVERESIVTHGYGLHSFAHSLVADLRAPGGRTCHSCAARNHQRIRPHHRRPSGRILPGVPETLQYLSERHHLILMTKGAVAEQTGKVERSGSEGIFRSGGNCVGKRCPHLPVGRFEVCSAFRATWMIGNSPKSDINPALAAGLNAVFVPHGGTWILEHEEVDSAEPPRRLLVVEKFAELRTHF